MIQTRSRLARRAGVLVLAGALASLAGTSAFAADGDGGSASVSATITAGSIGSRSVTVATASPMTSALNGSTLTGTLSVTVAEAARTGTNPWSVTAVLAGALASGGNTIPASNMSVSNRSFSRTLGGGTVSNGSGNQDLSAARTLFSVADQSATSVYTGSYSGTGDLTLSVPNGQAVGLYTGSITVTLVQ